MAATGAVGRGMASGSTLGSMNHSGGMVGVVAAVLLRVLIMRLPMVGSSVQEGWPQPP